jgi:hypothetical protein
MKKENDLKVIEAGFPKLCDKGIEMLKNQLIHADESESKISLVIIEPTENPIYNHVEVKALDIICEHGATKSYYVKIGDMDAKSIEDSDIESYIRKGIVLNGKLSESILEFQNTLNKYQDAFAGSKKENGRYLELDLKETKEIAQRLLLEKNTQTLKKSKRQKIK